MSSKFHVNILLTACNFIRKRLRCFHVNITKFLKTTFFIEHLRLLLLSNILKSVNRKKKLPESYFLLELHKFLRNAENSKFLCYHEYYREQHQDHHHEIQHKPTNLTVIKRYQVSKLNLKV